MRIEVATIGDEILSGRTRDGNFRHIARRLSELGLAVAHYCVLPDEPALIAAGLQAAAARCSDLIVTGGLGATPDDVTRSALSAAAGSPLVTDPRLESEIAARYRALGREPDAAAAALTRLPAVAQAIPNPVGLAPGIRMSLGACLVTALPGVPREMQAMFFDAVLPRLRARLAAGAVAPQRVALRRTTGVAENELARRLEPLCPVPGRIAYLPSAGRIDLRIVAPEASVPEAAWRAALEAIDAELGARCYARDPQALEAVVLAALAKRRVWLACAESLTGGLIGAAITRVPGSSRVLRGDLVTYHDEAKCEILGVDPQILARDGAVSAAVARQMAVGARERLRADVAVATTGIAGPTGGTPAKPVGLVYFGLADRAGTAVYRHRLGGDRALIQNRSVTLALDALRLHLLDRRDLLQPFAVA